MLDGVALILGAIQSYVIYGIRRKANRALSGTRILLTDRARSHVCKSACTFFSESFATSDA